jgi:hypothetical protein
MKQLIPLIKTISAVFGLDYVSIIAFICVETGGLGFDSKTGKIIIQFEPVWFKRKAPFTPSGFWSLNKVDVQSKEWEAFNNAFSLNPDAAMQSTSIGLGQIMGFHYSRLGYKTVGGMWDDAKKGLDRQIWQICKFIATDIKLQSSIKAHDWDGVATIYNGSGYKELAAKYGREPYNITMEKAYEKYKSL